MPATTQQLRESLAARIRAARRDAGLSGQQLADKVGVTRSAVQQWETGLAAPALDKQLAVARALKVEWSDLFRPSNRKTTAT